MSVLWPAPPSILEGLRGRSISLEMRDLCWSPSAVPCWLLDFGASFYLCSSGEHGICRADVQCGPAWDVSRAPSAVPHASEAPTQLVLCPEEDAVQQRRGGRAQSCEALPGNGVTAGPPSGISEMFSGGIVRAPRCR